jgi:hypothetical protein
MDAHAAPEPAAAQAGHAPRRGGTGHDDHSNVSDPLGPIDLTAWGAGILGIVLGLVVAAGLLIAAGGI